MSWIVLIIAVVLFLLGAAYAFALYRQADNDPWNSVSKIGLFSSAALGAILYAIILIKIDSWNTIPFLIIMAILSSAEMFVGGIKIFDNGFQEYLFPGTGHEAYCFPESDIFLILLLFAYCTAIITTVYFIANFFIRHANSKRWLSRNKPGQKSSATCVGGLCQQANSDSQLIHIFFGDSENARHLISDLCSNSNNLGQILLVDYPNEEELDVDVSLLERLRRLLSTKDTKSKESFSKVVRVIKARKRLTETVSSCIWEDMGLDSLKDWMIESQTTLYLLSDNQDENIQALTILIGNESLTVKRIFCHARRDVVTIEKENAIRSANQDKSGHYPDIRFLDSSSLAIKQLLLDENNDKLPVHYVNIKKDKINVEGKNYMQNAGYIEGAFNSMIIGFGEAGQDVLSYLVEQAAFIGTEEICKEDGSKNIVLTEKSFHCDVYDHKINEIYSHYMMSHPWMDADHAGVVTHEMDVLAESFWIDFCSKIQLLNYIVICLGNDRLNLQTAIEIARRIDASKEADKFCVLVKLSHPDKITDVTISNLNKAHNNHFHVFGQANDIWRESFISEEFFETRAKQYSKNYEMSQVGNIGLLPALINDDWQSLEKPDGIIDWLYKNHFERYSSLLYDLCYHKENNMSFQEFCTHYRINGSDLKVNESNWQDVMKSFPKSLINWINDNCTGQFVGLCAQILDDCKDHAVIERLKSLTPKDFAKWIHDQMIQSIYQAWDNRNYDIISSTTSNNTRFELIRKRSQDYANQIHAKTKIELMRGYILENARQISESIPSQFDGKTMFTGNKEIEKILERLSITEHLRWNASHIAMGYVYGKEKNSISRTHPCITEISSIDSYTKFYDWLVIKTTLNIYADEQ